MAKCLIQWMVFKMNKLNKLLNNNQVDINEFEILLTQTLLLALFEKICNSLNDDNSLKVQFSTLLRARDNEALALISYCNTHYNVNLDLEQANLLYSWISCYFRKSSTRKTYSPEYKKQLLEQQNFMCNCCNKEIQFTNSHLDHTIPWTYVGDELEDNLQMLCIDCNSSKNKSTSYLLLNCIMKRKKHSLI